MVEWNKYRKSNICIEIVGIIFCVIIIIGGIIGDIIVSRGVVLHGVEDIRSFSLTLLQIQASVGALTIALVALISGNVSDIYMGVSVSDYYLNLKPYILKQKIIVLLSMGLLVAGVFFHIGEAYNSVLGLFMVTIVLIVISVHEIYSIFNGKRRLHKEIESYISFVMGSNKGYQKKVDICDSFVENWEECIESQDATVYDRYVEMFCDYLLTLLKSETNEGVKDVERLCFSAVEVFLKSDKLPDKKRGIQLLDRIYEKMWAFISDNTDSIKKISVEYTLFGKLWIEFQEAINDIPIEMVEKIVNWIYMSDSIERVAFWITDKSKGINLTELDSINYIARFWGIYLRKQKQKGNIINGDYWGNTLEHVYLTSAYNVPEEYAEEFLRYKVEMYFNYCYGLINNGLGCIIKESLYLRGMKTLHSIQNRYEAIFYLAIQCYLYYLAERECEDCVAPEIKEDASLILYDKQIKEYNEYIIRLLTYREDFLDLQLEQDIYKLLKPYELRSRYSNVKTLIMQRVVREFFLFIILHIENKSYMPGLIAGVVDNDTIEEYYLDFLGEREEETKSKFSKLSMLYNVRISDEKIRVQVNSMYENLESIVKKKYKEKSITKAEEHQKTYETSNKQEQIIMDIKSEVSGHLQEKFAPIITENENNGGVFKLHLLSSNEFTARLNSNKVNQYFGDLDGAFVNGLTFILQKRGLVENKNRMLDFADDVDYIGYLRQTGIDMLLGAKHILKNKDYKNKECFKEYSQGCECIYTGFVSYGLALKSDDIKICIRDINVSIHSLTFGETSLNFDEGKQRYIYEISHNMPVEFTKEELKSFIRNERKVLDISAKVSIVTEKEKVGIVVT